jgi:hypothetical protein
VRGVSRALQLKAALTRRTPKERQFIFVALYNYDYDNPP